MCIEGEGCWAWPPDRDYKKGLKRAILSQLENAPGTSKSPISRPRWELRRIWAVSCLCRYRRQICCEGVRNYWEKIGMSMTHQPCTNEGYGITAQVLALADLQLWCRRFEPKVISEKDRPRSRTWRPRFGRERKAKSHQKSARPCIPSPNGMVCAHSDHNSDRNRSCLDLSSVSRSNALITAWSKSQICVRTTVPVIPSRFIEAFILTPYSGVLESSLILRPDNIPTPPTNESPSKASSAIDSWTLSTVIGCMDPSKERSGLNVRISTYSSHLVYHYSFPFTQRLTSVLQLTLCSCD